MYPLLCVKFGNILIIFLTNVHTDATRSLFKGVERQPSYVTVFFLLCIKYVFAHPPISCLFTNFNIYLLVLVVRFRVLVAPPRRQWGGHEFPSAPNVCHVFLICQRQNAQRADRYMGTINIKRMFPSGRRSTISIFLGKKQRVCMATRKSTFVLTSTKHQSRFNNSSNQRFIRKKKHKIEAEEL